MDSKTQKEMIEKMLRESPRKACSCGCEYFDTATVKVEVSALMSPTGKSEILLAGVLVCRKCGKEDAPSLIQT
jgi:hypothetical protein